MKNSGRISGMIKKKTERQQHKQTVPVQPSPLNDPDELLLITSSGEFQEKYVKQQSKTFNDEDEPLSISWDSKSEPTHHQTHKQASLQCELLEGQCQPPLCSSCGSIQKLQKQNLRLVERCMNLLEWRHRMRTKVSGLAQQGIEIVSTLGNEQNSRAKEVGITLKEIIQIVNEQIYSEIVDKEVEYKKRLELESEHIRKIDILSENLERVKAVVMEAQDMFEQTKRALEEDNRLDPEALRADVNDLYEAITSKKLNVSIEEEIVQPQHIQSSPPAKPTAQTQTPEQPRLTQSEQKLLTQFDNPESERQNFKEMARVSIESKVTAFDPDQSPLRPYLQPKAYSSEAVTSHQDNSLKLDFTKKGEPYSEPKNYMSMDHKRASSKGSLICFSDKRPPKNKSQSPTDPNDELRMMLLVQALTIQRFIEESGDASALHY